jgi:hypothetical protein
MKVRAFVMLLGVVCSSTAAAGPFAPAAGQPGSTAIAANDPAFVGWATGFENLVRGPQNIAVPGGALASYGSGANALGPADATSANGGPIVSLGDGGQITLTFASPITDGPGYDFAVFENGFADEFLELAFVEVSTNGSDFVRFPAVSLTPTDTQVGSFDPVDPTNIDNLAGKYRAGFGMTFDLTTIAGLSAAVDPNQINFVRIVDVVGALALGSLDSLGNPVNDPYPTAFASGGFDLDAVGVLHTVPEPAAVVFMAGAIITILANAGLARMDIHCFNDYSSNDSINNWLAKNCPSPARRR